LSCFQTRECQALEETVAHLHEQLSQALEANDLLSESIIFQQYTDNNLQTGSQIHKENPESIDISDELHQKAEQVCLFSALRIKIISINYRVFVVVVIVLDLRNLTNIIYSLTSQRLD
jgi:hypothetical protein